MIDEPKIVQNLPYLHIVHPLPNASNLPFPPTAESNEQVVDVLAPAFMKMLDLAFDALRTGEGKQDGGWNLLITLYVSNICAVVADEKGSSPSHSKIRTGLPAPIAS
jgi:hypothetical protein